MKLNVFISKRKDGIMSKDKEFFPNLNKEERELLYESTLKRFFLHRNISLENVVLLPEKNDLIKKRSATKDLKKFKEAIIILKDTTRDLIVACETNDYPVITVTAKKEDGHSFTAIALGTIKNLNNNLLHEMIESLIEKTNAAPFEMTFYISPCPSKNEFLVTDLNEFTNTAIWKDALIKIKNKTYLDLRYAIFNNLIKEIVDPNYIYFDSTDPIKDENYFSTIGNKPGKNLVCVVYSDEEV